MDVLPENLAKSRSLEIGFYNNPIAHKFDNATAKMTTKFQRDCYNLNLNSWFRDFTRSCGKESVCSVTGGPVQGIGKIA